jgi:phosphopantetheine--protein transferase-like protein
LEKRHLRRRAKPLLGIGIDIESVDRFRKELRSSSRLISKVFTEGEIAYCMAKADPPVHFAGCFAAKEAAFKAFNSLHAGRFVITDFEVLHGRDGAPRIKRTASKAWGKSVDVEVSVSHTALTAVAAALAIVHE